MESMQQSHCDHLRKGHEREAPDPVSTADTTASAQQQLRENEAREWRDMHALDHDFYVQISLAGAITKHMGKLRNMVTGNWRGIPPHVTMFELYINSSMITSRMVLFLQENMSSAMYQPPVANAVRSVSDDQYVRQLHLRAFPEPDDIRLLGQYWVVRYDVDPDLMERLRDEMIAQLIELVRAEYSSAASSAPIIRASVNTYGYLVTYYNDIPIIAQDYLNQHPREKKLHVSIARDIDMRHEIYTNDEIIALIREHIASKFSDIKPSDRTTIKAFSVVGDRRRFM